MATASDGGPTREKPGPEKEKAHDAKSASSADTIKKDADGAFAPSQADSTRDGSLTISTTGDDDPRKGPDEHSAPIKPLTGNAPKPK